MNNVPLIDLHEANLDPVLIGTVRQCLAVGLRVYALAPGTRATGFFWVCRDVDGPFATVNRPSYAFQPLSVSVPVKPDTRWGSGVPVADEDTPTLDAVLEAVEMDEVKIRFVPGHENTVVPNRGAEVLDYWLKGGKVVEIVRADR